MALLEVKNLRVRFETHHGTVNAVDGVSFQVDQGETLGLVGESGSGKSVTNLALMGLIPSPPGVVIAESMMYGKRNLLKLSDAELRSIRGNEIAMIFQDPMTSLNPLLTIERQLTEVLMLHKGKSRKEARKLAAAGLGDVGIPNPEARLDTYPHELSGGMRQRVMIAMALLCKPRILIADEPTTALDVTIQAQILELMKDMQKKYGMAIIMVTHDLGVVAGMTDRINVMYAGRLAESAPVVDLFARPLHPYTKGLLASVPTVKGDPNANLYSIPGSPPDLSALPNGCSFGPRCSLFTPRCDQEKPALRQLKDEVSGAKRRVACIEVKITDDPNKELFAELERQERKGAPGAAKVWTPKTEPKAESTSAPKTVVAAPEPKPMAPPAPQAKDATDTVAKLNVEPEPATEPESETRAPILHDTPRGFSGSTPKESTETKDEPKPDAHAFDEDELPEFGDDAQLSGSIDAMDSMDDPFALSASEDSDLDDALNLDDLDDLDEFDAELDAGEWKVIGGTDLDQADDQDEDPKRS